MYQKYEQYILSSLEKYKKYLEIKNQKYISSKNKKKIIQIFFLFKI